LFLIFILTLGGCATINVTSDPPGAEVLHSYLGGTMFSRRWMEWKPRCITPCTFKSDAFVSLIKVRWPDNSMSDVRNADKLSIHNFYFTKGEHDLPILE